MAANLSGNNRGLETATSAGSTETQVDIRGNDDATRAASGKGGAAASRKRKRNALTAFAVAAAILVAVAIYIGVMGVKQDDTTNEEVATVVEDYFSPDAAVSEDLYKLPEGFKIGAASAAYQVEGAWDQDGKSPSIQDVFHHSRPYMENGDVACDSYHKWQDDVQLLRDLKMQIYRFSLSWARLLPTGGADYVNPLAVEYYNKLIDSLLAAGIEPVVTIHHWDMPQAYQDDGGWLDAKIQDRYVEFADFCFKTFGDRVKRWVLLNEPRNFCNVGYEVGIGAPGVAWTGSGAYACVHNSILAHAKAYRRYESAYKQKQQGQMGTTLDLVFAQPRTASAEDAAAAQRLMEFMFAWLADPLAFGDYPAGVRAIVDANSRAAGLAGSRLPAFTDSEKDIIRGSWDFIGLNHYSTSLVSVPDASTLAAAEASLSNDTMVVESISDRWVKSSREMSPVTPWGMREVLRWIKNRYNNMPVVITENGYPGYGDEGTTDPARAGYHSGFMRAALRAINEDGCNVVAYIAWSLEDNLEWGVGFTARYGLTYVDVTSPNRTRILKDSAKFFQEVATTRRVPYVKAV